MAFKEILDGTAKENLFSVRESILKLIHASDTSLVIDRIIKFDRTRKIHCTPFDGADGIVGWVVVPNGSPPSGILIFQCDDKYELVGLVVIESGRCREVNGSEQRRILTSFFDCFLLNATEPFTL